MKGSGFVYFCKLVYLCVCERGYRLKQCEYKPPQNENGYLLSNLENVTQSGESKIVHIM